MQCVDPVAGGLCAACGSGNASGNDCAYVDATGITHGDRDARAPVHRNADATADYHRCDTHGDAGHDVYNDA